MKGISPKICVLCVHVKINKRSFEPFCVWISLFRVFCSIFSGLLFTCFLCLLNGSLFRCFLMCFEWHII